MFKQSTVPMCPIGAKVILIMYSRWKAKDHINPFSCELQSLSNLIHISLAFLSFDIKCSIIILKFSIDVPLFI